jgi:hypothetical protein
MATNKEIIIDFLTILSTIFSTILYIYTLKPCYGTQTECLELYSIGMIMLAMRIIFLSSFLFSVILIMTLYYKRLKCFLFCCLSFIIIYLIDSGTSLDSHGGYNRLILLISLAFFIFVYLFIIVFFLFCRFKIFTLFIIIIVLYFSYYFNIYFNNCENWDSGFKNSKIKYNRFCNINIPYFCIRK